MSVVQLRFFKRYFCRLMTMSLGPVFCFMLPYIAEASFSPGQVTDPTCLPSDPACIVDLFQIPSTGVIIGSATTSPSSVTNRLYNLSGALYWGGSALGLSSGSINILDGISASIQYFAASSSGSDFSISSASSTHTFSLPNAGVSARGLVSTSSQVFAGAKTFAGGFVASSSVILSSTLQLSNLSGGLLLTDSSGNVSTSSLNQLLSNTLSSSLNTLISTINGNTSTTSIINSVVSTSSGNSIVTSVNGISSASSTIINSNSVNVSGGVLTTAINGVTATGSLTTSGVSEGSNLYYTNTRDNANFASNLAATTSDALAEGPTNKYFTNARVRSALSNTATGLAYDSSTGSTSLSSGYTIPLVASTSDWQGFFGAPSSRVIAGAGLLWSGNTLLNNAIPVLASSTADGLISTTTQSFAGSKTFNGPLVLASTLGVTGTTTLATTTVSQFTVNGAAALSAAVTLSALGGGLLQTSVGGVVSTTSIGALTTNAISSVANVLTSIVNGVTSTTTAVNSVSNTSSANTLSTTVNGVTGSTVNIINSNALSWSGQTLTSTVNGIAATVSLPLASATGDGLVSSSTQTFGGNKTFVGDSAFGGSLGVTGTSTLATTTATQLTTSGAATLAAAVTLTALGGGLLQANSSGVVSTTSIGVLTNNSLSSLNNTLTSIINGVTSTTTTVNSVANTSNVNTLSTTVNGVSGSSVSIINTNGLSWLGQTLTSTINGVAAMTSLSLAGATTDGLVSSSTQTFGGAKTFNGSVSLASTLGVTGTSTFATTSVTQLTASNVTTLTAGLTLTALGGGLLQTNSGGSVSTTSIGALTTHTISSLSNILTSIVNGVTSTTTAVNSVSNTSNANTLSTTVNGITGSTVNIINTSALAWSGQTLTSTINGVATTTSIPYANATTDGLVSTTTQTFAGNKTFNGSVGIGSAPSYTLDVRSSANSGVTGFFQATNSTINGIVTVQDATDASPGTSKLFAAFQNSSGGNVGTISGGVIGGVLFNSISDRRLKDNISTTTIGLSTLMRIPVRDFSMKIDPEHRIMQGYIAQELNQIYPFAVSKTDDDGEGVLSATATPWAVDYGRLTPLIVKSIQDEELQISSIFGSTTVASSSYLSPDEVYGTVTASTVGSVGDYFKDKIIGGVNITREIVSGKMTALEGWFNRIVSNEYCSRASSGEMICMNGDDMKRLLQNSQTLLNVVPTSPASTMQTTTPSVGSSTADSRSSGASISVDASTTPPQSVGANDTLNNPASDNAGDTAH